MKYNRFTLVFEGTQERSYREAQFRDSLPVIRIAFFTALLLYSIFSLMEWGVMSAHTPTYLFIRFVLVIPFLITVLIWSFFASFKGYWQTMLFLSFLVAGFGASFLISIDPDRHVYYSGLLLIYMGGYFFLRLRFFLASVAGWLILACFNLVMLLMTDVTSSHLISYNYIYISANLVGMFASYYIEVSNRRNFILTRQLDQKSSELGEINQNLGQLVDSRTRELQESEQRYRLLIENMAEVVMFVDNDDRVLFVNNTFCDVLGYRRDEIIGQIGYEVLLDDPSEKQRIRNANRIRLGGIQSKYEIQFKARDGHKIDFLVSGAPMYDSQRNVIGSMGVMTDVSRMKDVQRDLMESEERFRSLSDLLPLIVYETDLHGNITYVNQQGLIEFGYQPEEVQAGVNILDVVAPEDRERAESEMLEALKADRIYKGEFLAMRRDGSVFPIIDYSNAIIRNGNVYGLRCVVADMSEQKEAEQSLKSSEERYRLLAENAFDGIYLSKGGRFEYVNQRFCEITGYDEQTLLSPDFHFDRLLTPESYRLITDRRHKRKKNREVANTVEIQILTRTGEIKEVELSAALIHHIPELFILGVARDITERKVNEKLRNEIVVARQSAEFKQQFLANMSHEIRTPLTGVIGMIEILANSGLDEHQRDYLHTLKLSTENLREIINQILDYSKIEAGQVMLKPVMFKTGKLFENAQKLFRSVCRKSIELQWSVDEKLPPFIQADKQRVGQVISNLLSNAIKFTETGSIHLRAHMYKRFDDKGLMIRVEVQDTGIGIQEEKQKLLFKPFSQIDHKDTRNFEGTGLGLSICKDLVKLMGGKIGVKSVVGEGSLFWFTFRAEMIDQLPPKEDSADYRVLPKRDNLRILLVEDKLVNQKVISLILSSMGHLITTANNGQHALEVYKPDMYDLILMDIQMPVMDGISATRELKRQYSAKLPPIVGLSANAFEGDREKYMGLGMDEYLTKPVTGEDFKRLIHQLF